MGPGRSHSNPNQKADHRFGNDEEEEFGAKTGCRTRNKAEGMPAESKHSGLRVSGLGKLLLLLLLLA